MEIRPRGLGMICQQLNENDVWTTTTRWVIFRPRNLIFKFDPEMWSRNFVLKFDPEMWSWNFVLKFDPEISSWNLILKFDFVIWPWTFILKFDPWNLILKFDPLIDFFKKSCDHSSLFNYWQNCLKSNLKIKNLLKPTLYYLTNRAIKVFKHLHLISIKKKRIFNVPLNTFLFNNWKKLECSQIFTFLGFKMIWSSRYSKII